MIYRLRWCISTHILTKRMTGKIQESSGRYIHFNSHPHEEDDLRSVQNLHIFRLFQLTSSRRGWLRFRCHIGTWKRISTHILTKRMTIAICSATAESLFQLTSSRRGWLSCKGISLIRFAFQLTSSRRGWPGFIYCVVAFSHYFNSHPHEEDDVL